MLGFSCAGKTEGKWATKVEKTAIIHLFKMHSLSTTM